MCTICVYDMCVRYVCTICVFVKYRCQYDICVQFITTLFCVGASTIRAYSLSDDFIRQSEQKVDTTQIAYYHNAVSNR